MFPNSYNVYIHDTPSREHFARDDRALSSGCIRIQKPLELARLLLSDQPMWSDDRIATAMNSSNEQVVMLKRKVPVVMLYLTFWTDAKGVPMFREDIYERDELLHKALLRPFPLIPKV
jgi:murein L,D-transpeptidase YcbB/YkuD